MSALDPLERWRLILGDAAEHALGPSEAVRDLDAALGFLYDRERGRRGRGLRTATGAASDAPSELTVPRWLDEVHRLFPREAAVRLERDAIERYGLTEVLTDPDLLERVEPSPTLLRAVLRTKHRMSPEVLDVARRLVARVVADLRARLEPEIRASFGGARDRRRASALRVSRNLDLRETVRRNLHRYDPETRRVSIERPRFVARTRHHARRWQLILLVDQSGSMLGSVIHAAVTAACFWGLPGTRCHLATFDTSVVDLTPHVVDPVELLMRVQLGGGTDLGRALAYASERIENPRRTVVVLISDLYDGGDREALVGRARSLLQQGVRLLVLGALDERAEARFDRELGQRLADQGAEVGAMTPAALAELVAETVAR